MLIRKKAIATHTIVLVIMMGLFAIFGFLLFYKWVGFTEVEATAATCGFKKIFYCEDWKANGYRDEPWNWNDKPPAGCDRFDVTKPGTRDDCKGLA